MEGSSFKSENTINCIVQNDGILFSYKSNPMSTFVREQRIISSGTESPVIKYEMPELHALVAVATLAFNNHWPIILSPDDFLLPIIQSFTVGRPPRGAGGGEKVQLSVRKDDFFEPTADWSSVIESFQKQITEHIGPEKASLFDPGSMSTTGPYQRTAYGVALMDMHQNQFSYETYSFCGIPKVTLRGTQQDWQQLHTKVSQLLAVHECKIQQWKDELLSILQEIATNGTGNVEFWRNFYKYREGSGGAHITGWINALFPTVRSGKNPPQYATKIEEIKNSHGRSLLSFPLSVCCAPGTHTHVPDNTKYTTAFYAGQVGIGQDPKSTALFPVWGWAIGATKK